VRILVLGGNRSGKSRFAETLLVDAVDVEYVAPAVVAADDPQWAQRVRAHRERRPASWRTVETGDVAPLLVRSGPAVLLDSVTAWLTRAMDECGAWDGADSPDLDRRVDALCSAWAGTGRHVVAVSDEVGSGVVPASSSGRRFRDELGLLNQRLAATADEVHLVVAGLPLRLR
jgi:adenosylcobinamide kinase/adenosylcobinamide-phosphate guanylyltransferase